MVHVMIGIFIFVGVIAVTTLLFSGWAVYGVVRAIARGITALVSPLRPRRPDCAGGTGRGANSLSAGTVSRRQPAGRRSAGGAGAVCRGCHGAGEPPPERRQQVVCHPAPARPVNRIAVVSMIMYMRTGVEPLSADALPSTTPERSGRRQKTRR